MAANTKMVGMALLHLPNVVVAQCLLDHTVRGLQRQDDSRVWRDQIRRNVHEGLLWFSTRPAAAGSRGSGGVPRRFCCPLRLQHLKAQFPTPINTHVFEVGKQ